MRMKCLPTTGLLLLMIAMLLAGCGRNRNAEIEIAVALTQTAVALEQEADAVEAATSTPMPATDGPTSTTPITDLSAPLLLPAPLHFVDRETQQVVRLEMDGKTRTQLTDEAAAIRDFDVQPEGRKIAYVVDNTLIELDLTTGERVVKVVGDEITGDRIEDRLQRRLHEPHYSPDGRQIAFGLGGINLIDSGTGNDITPLLTSSPYPNANSAAASPAIDPIRFFWPKGWAPGGDKLLVEFAYYSEAGGLAIFDLAQNRLIDFSSDDPEATRCCDAAWSPDGRQLYLASNLLAYSDPGLSVVDSASGVVTSVAHGLPAGDLSASPFRFFRAPFVDAVGLLVFLNRTSDLAQQMLTYRLTRASGNGESFTPLRNDVQPLEGEVVWSADGRGIAYLKDVRIEGEWRTGSVVWLPVNGSPVDLPIAGQSLRFAMPQPPFDTAIIPPTYEYEEDEASAALSGFAAEAWGFDVTDEPSGEPGIDGLFTFPLRAGVGDVPLWATHTVGLRSFEPEQFHTVGIFTREDEMWQELARIELGKEVDANNAEPVPDFLEKGSVTQVFVEPEHTWLSVEGGTGAHSGTFNLLSFDGDSLRTEASGFSASPGVAKFADLNGDGIQEVLLDATDYYVFCYACGVRLVQYNLLRWNRSRMEQVLLQDLPDSASAELRELNDLALELVGGGLWKDALATVEEGRTLQEGDPTFMWNAILVELNAKAKREAAGSEYGYAILDQIFYGDYDAAVDAMRDYRPEEIFTQESPLILGTAAEGSTELLADWITRTTASALNVLPDLASAHYLRGWAGYLLTEENERALPDVAHAAAVEQDDPLFDESIALLLGDDVSAPAAAGSSPSVRATAAEPRAAATLIPSTSATPASTGTLRARTRVNVRAGPGTGAAEIGEIAEAEITEVTGRTGEGASLWWQIVYPTGSEDRGWVTGDPALVAVAAPDAPAIEIEIEDAVPTTEVRPPAGDTSARLFFSAQNEENETVIYQLQADGTATQVVEMAAQPAIQPGGERLAFYSTRDDMLGLGGYDLEAGERLRFSFNIEDALPTWHPSSQQIVFASTRYGDGRSRLYAVWADGEGDAVDIGYGQDPDWHPSEELLVMKGCDQSGSKCGLWTLGPDGSNRRRLTENANDARPVWTPDGSAIIFMNNDRDDNWELYRLNIADNNITRLTDNPANDGLPAVSADGSQVAFMSDRGGTWSIQTMPITGGEPETLYTIGDSVVNWLQQGIAWER